MRLRSRLPRNRWQTGRLWVEKDDGSVMVGPWLCRGKADSQFALQHHNPDRDPLKPFGDHPTGTYTVAALVHGKLPESTYGPCFILLDPIGGDALKAEEAERRGLAIHGGQLTPDGSLRATEGCLRTTNAAVAILAGLVPIGTEYVCEEGLIA